MCVGSPANPGEGSLLEEGGEREGRGGGGKGGKTGGRGGREGRIEERTQAIPDTTRIRTWASLSGSTCGRRAVPTPTKRSQSGLRRKRLGREVGPRKSL